MNRKIQIACALAGPVAIIGALIGWLIAGVLPIPPAADLSADQVVDFYSRNPVAMQAGLALAIVALGGIGALTAVIGTRMLRMEGQTPVLTFVQLIAGSVTWVMLIVPLVIMIVASFRPERSPEITMTLNDLAWLLFVPPVGPFLVQNAAIAIAILTDRSAEPVLPRWVAYTNLWIAFLFLPGILAYFFKSGPFAWHGIFAFWLALSAYAAWAFVMGLTVRRSILREAMAEPAQVG
jgi:hypothetical protein